MAVYLGMGHTVTEQFVTGDIGYVPMGAGHYIRNTGSGILRLLIGFNNGHYHSHDLSAWVASNPPDVLATNLGLPPTSWKRFLRRRYLSHDPPTDGLTAVAEAIIGRELPESPRNSTIRPPSGLPEQVRNPSSVIAAANA